MGRVRSPKRRVRDDDFVFGLSSDILESSFYWRKHSAQYLLMLEGDLIGSAHWKWRFICDADEGCDSFCVAGAVFGEVGGWLFVPGAAFRDILGDSRSAKCCILQYKIVSKMGRVRSPKRRVRDDDFVFGLSSDILGYPRVVFLLARSTSGSFRSNLELQDFVAGAVFGEVGGWLDWLRALEMTFHMWRRSSRTFILRGRRSIWWCWRVTLLAPRIGNDVSYVTQISDDIHFAWQAQYLVMLEGDFTCSTYWKWRFICDADQWWHSFCVAGATQRWCWRVTLLAPRIGNDVSYVTQISDDIHFAWQAH